MTTQLPEPNFIDRNATTITKEWIELYESRTGKTLQDAQIERILIDIGSYRENLIRIKIQEIAKLNLLNYASLDILKHIGELVGVPILEAKYSSAKFIFILEVAQDFDIIIPTGTQIETNDGKYIFETTETAIIKANNLSVEVYALCTTAGALSNGYALNSITNLINPIGYVLTVKNITVTSGGQDEESADNFRERIRQAPESFSNAGSKGAYKFHTLSADQSIIDVVVVSPSAGVVEIYPLVSSGTPSDELISTVQAYLSDDKIRPLTDNVIVKKPEAVDFSITAKLTLYSYADITSVQAAVNEGLNSYKMTLKSKLNKDIVPNQIIAILNAIYGVYNIELISPEFQSLEANQWANLQEINISYEGEIDE
ncbi:MAG: baseplate J/gp47 family protein [Bacteroidales bacterium]|nr:baseplate J/gp47 family protein [Bacteroidales bacterium]